MTLKHVWARFVRNDEGQDLIEYVLLGSLIALVVVGGSGGLGTHINIWYQKVSNWVSTQTVAVP